jgi:hypothetical protein
MRADRPRLRGRHAAAITIALIAAIALAACGGSSSPSKSTASAKTTSPASGASGASGFASRTAALATCLRQHGVTLPSGAGGFGAGHFGGFGASGRFGATGASGAFRRFGASGASGRFGRFGFGASGRFGPTGASGPRGSFASNPKYAAALRACAADLGGGFAGGGGFARPGASTGAFNPNSAADRAAVTSYVACVRKHGFDLPAPNFSGKGPVFNTAHVNTSNPKFIAASSACQSLLHFASGT